MEQCHWLTGEPVLSALSHSTPPCPSECLTEGEEASKATTKSAAIKYKICWNHKEPFERDTAKKQPRQRKSPLPLTFSIFPSSPPFLGKPRTKYQQGSYLFNYLSRLWLIIRRDNGAFVMLFTCRCWLTAPLLNSKANSCCHDRLATGQWWISTRDGWLQ